MSAGTKLSRREALRNIVLLSAGASALLFGASDLLGLFSQKSHPSIQKVEQAKAQTTTSASSTTALNIRVVYLGMPVQTTGTHSENVLVSAPAYLGDLISKLEKMHPGLVAMAPSMQIVLNGLAAEGNPMLKDGDEVDFIPFSAGG